MICFLDTIYIVMYMIELYIHAVLYCVPVVKGLLCAFMNIHQQVVIRKPIFVCDSSLLTGNICLSKSEAYASEF